MSGLWMLVKEGGWGAMLALFFGFIGLLVGPGAALTLVFSRRGAFYVGVVSLLVATLTAGVGLLGMMSGRHATDSALGMVSPGVQQERIRHQGYKEAQGAAKIGFGASAVPLLLGLLVVAMGAGAKPKTAMLASHAQPQGAFAPPPPNAPSSGGRWMAGGIVASFALVTCAGALAAAMAALPKGKYDFLPEDMDAWSLAEARETFDSDKLAGCDALDASLDSLWASGDRRQWPRQFLRDPDPLVPDWRTIATICVETIWIDVKAKDTTTRPATGASSPFSTSRAPKPWTREALLDSPLLIDEKLHAEILARSPPEQAFRGFGNDIGDSFGAGGLGLGVGLDGGGGYGSGTGYGSGIGLGNIGTRGTRDGGVGPGRRTPSLRAGSLTVNGRLPPEVIQRIVRQNFGRFRLCYETALRDEPTLEGTVKVKFVIGTDGSVSTTSDGGSDLPNETVKSCVRRGFANLSFPQPEGGIVVVVYPIVFQPGA